MRRRRRASAPLLRPAARTSAPRSLPGGVGGLYLGSVNFCCDEEVKICRPFNFTDSKTQPFHESSHSPSQQRSPQQRATHSPAKAVGTAHLSFSVLRVWVWGQVLHAGLRVVRALRCPQWGLGVGVLVRLVHSGRSTCHAISGPLSFGL